MQQHTKKIKQENKELRRELQDLIQLTSALQQQKARLEKQYKDLTHEQKFAQELDWLRAPMFSGLGEVEDLDLKE